MSSNENNDKDHISNNDEEKLEGAGQKFNYYFDIFYRISKGLIGFIVLLVAVVGFLAGGAVIGYFASLVESAPIPTPDEISAQVNDYNQTSTLYYADNSPISDIRSDLFRTPVTIDEVSPLIVNAVIATEDESYRTHEGVVPKAIIRAGIQEIMNADSVSGGSTLTQQLIKQQILSNEVTHSRKAIEILYAIHLENHFNKEEILEAYLNISPFGRNNQGRNIAGVEEAAQGIFGVSAAEVTLPQASFIAGLPQSPIAYSPYYQDGSLKEDLSAGLYRQQEVLYSMFREGYITEDVYQEALTYDVTADFIQQSKEDGSFDSELSYEYDLVFEEARDILLEQMLITDGITQEQINNDPTIYDQYLEDATNALINKGYRVYSTIEKDIHQAVQAQITANKDSFGQTRTLTSTNEAGETVEHVFETQVAGTMIDNTTGKVLAFVGGRDFEESNHNNAFKSRRLSGSVLKPLLVYGPALAENIITPATIIPDIAVSIPDGPNNPNYEPTNYGRTTNYWRSARYWLTVSQNLPVVRLYQLMLNQNVDVRGYFRSMGIGPEAVTDAEFSHLASSLGGFSGGPTATEIAGAYAAVGNKGVFNPPYVIEKIENAQGDVIYEHEPNPQRVWSEAANYLLYDMMRDVTTSQYSSSTPARNNLTFSADVAGKSGISNDFMDVWFAGVTPKISLVTWMGYGNNDLSLEYYGGMSGPQRNLRNWTNIMNTVYSLQPELIGANQTFARPSDNSITSATILSETGMKPGSVKIPGQEEAISYTTPTRSEVFARNNVPGTTTYNFAIGAKPEEQKKFWDDYIKKHAPKEEEKEEEDNNDDDSDENESESENNNQENNQNTNQENNQNNSNNESESTPASTPTPPASESEQNSESATTPPASNAGNDSGNESDE